MSKSNQKSQQEPSAVSQQPPADNRQPIAESGISDSRQPIADSRISDSQQATAEPIYQNPMGNEPQSQEPSAPSHKPTADGCIADSRQPLADCRIPDSRQPLADCRIPDSRQQIADSCSSDEINLLDYLRVIYKYKWMIMILTIIAMAATVAMSLRQPRMYQANTSIVPPTDRLSSGGGLAGKLGGAGSMLLQGVLSEGNLSGLYIGILESRTVSEALIDRFDLTNGHGKVITRTVARGILKANTTIKASAEGVVHVTVKDRDPNRVAALANAYVEELDQQNKRLSGSQATSKRIFLENRLKEIQEELTRIDSLQSREVQIKEMLFELLNRECEIAKIEEAKSMPTIQVLDKATVPEISVGRGTAKKGVSVGIAAMMLGSFIAFGRAYAVSIRESSQ